MPQKTSTFRGNFKPSAAAEREFYKSLRRVAQVSGGIVDAHVQGAKILNDAAMTRELKRYSQLIEPWAIRQSKKLLEAIARSNKSAYTRKSKTMGRLLNTQLDERNVQVTALALMNEQVELIKSLPIEAGLRAQKIAFEAALAGTRAEVNTDTVRQLEKEMGMTTEVATSRAMLIARTETARANAYINQARAQSVGSHQYRWHNSGDEAVRHSHKVYKGRKLQGMIFSWDAPPTLDDGMTGHPGTFPNCRCFAEPVFEDE